MPTTDTNLAERSGSLVESHKGYDPRIVFFYFIIAALFVLLGVGLGYQQLHLIGEHAKREREQNQRRILLPAPRGNIYDRNGTLLVGNAAQWTVVLHTEDLRAELNAEHIRIHKLYAEAGAKKKDITYSQLEQLARLSVAQRYLDRINQILHRQFTVNARALEQHFQRAMLLPFTLADGLTKEEYAALIEHLPVNSPVEVYPEVMRTYPFGSAAAHTLGYVRKDAEIEAEDFPGADLPGQFKQKGTSGKDGLEKWFDAELQGEPGGRIYLVDPAGFKIKKPLEERPPKKGRDLVTSLDIDLQRAAEQALQDTGKSESDPQVIERPGAAVAIDIRTGEVLVMASKPDYDLNEFSPRASQAVVDQMNESKAWNNLALNGSWSPGSTFKILVSIAGLRSGLLNPDDTSVNCDGYIMLGRTRKGCDNGLAHHGNLALPDAIAESCDIYFYRHGIDLGPTVIAAEARRFHLGQLTGIELPGETSRGNIPTPEWKRAEYNQPWTDGDTANMAIGQGFVDVTPLQMACFTASVARGETFTRPTLLHDPNRPPQHTEPIGLTPAQRTALISGMEGVIEHGTAAKFFAIPGNQIPGVKIAGKTGTAQRQATIDGKTGNINIAWFICFAPADRPEIAIAATVQGDTIGENYAGGLYAAGIAEAVLKKYFEKKAHPAQVILSPLKRS
jgi:penicillin-binding protein 2